MSSFYSYNEHDDLVLFWSWRSYFIQSLNSKSLAAGFFILFSICFVPINASAHSKDDPNRWMAPEKMSHRENPISKTPKSIQQGRDLYMKHCALCHGSEALGDGPAAKGLKQKPSNLVAMSGMHADGDVAWKIAEGRGVMPGFKKRFTDEQVWDLVNFIQNLKGTGEEHQVQEMKKH